LRSIDQGASGRTGRFGLQVADLIGAGPGERRPDDRATHRNGYRPRRWDTGAGELELQTPRLRQGTYFPSSLENRKRSEQALPP
jgi:putative transposase